MSYIALARQDHIYQIYRNIGYKENLYEIDSQDWVQKNILILHKSFTN